MAKLEEREGEYGDKVLALEPGGIEAIPAKDRHGKASQLFATWMSPNLEFATIYIGVLGVVAFGLSFTQAALGILIGNALGALGQYVLTKDGPKYGVPQMVIGRAAFGKLGNILPAVANAGAAGVGWFAVNSVSGAYALSDLTKMKPVPSLVIVVLVEIVVAFIGHNLVQSVEKYLFPYLVIVFGAAGVYAFTSSHTHLGAAAGGHVPGGFLILVGAVYGYAAGWNPFSSDYARYLPATESGEKAGRAAGLGIFVSGSLLQIIGAAAATAGVHLYGADTNPTGDFTSLMPNWLGKLVLLGIVAGSICANVLNVYSGSMSFLTLGIKVGSTLRRAIAAVVFGVAGFLLAKAALGNPANNYENFLLIMSYWVGPWLGVVLADKFIRKGASVESLLFANRENIAGPIAWVIGTSFSIWGFVNQTWGHGKSFHYVLGYFVKKNGSLGDITFFVGFIVAFVIYYILAKKKVSAEK